MFLQELYTSGLPDIDGLKYENLNFKENIDKEMLMISETGLEVNIQVNCVNMLSRKKIQNN